MPSINIIMLQTVAYGLRELKEEVVFIGLTPLTRTVCTKLLPAKPFPPEII